ncbi:type III pantothenate kinase [Rickettsiales endosymbiont of Peranema trichophorum]|uniref:type III pantothenate kinase n=1 Tax=Rickettsiales endosymbiont of Peranema trichophorum TaxID=2486577 RepID=UPI00102359F7|nr:type III pantothenate kinase [Rickettsiales endosymbiont of Peranema trichophorum]RZI46724.1 type III pantothenate kinase [Rickettsiales endosymbiont of Peranema trichophorum]
MILCIDIGNSHIFFGICLDGSCLVTFRHTSNQSQSSDQLGLFLKFMLREHNIDISDIKGVSISSVVPGMNYSITAACIKYLKITPTFLSHSMDIDVEVDPGADRIANAIAGFQLFPNSNLIILDFGTATTMCCVTKTKKYVCGAILPGINTAAKALGSFTAKLPTVDIRKPQLPNSHSIQAQIQFGLFYGQSGALKELIGIAKREYFSGEEVTIVGTGGVAYLFQDEKVFDHLVPNLVLLGLYHFFTKAHDQ